MNFQFLKPDERAILRLAVKEGATTRARRFRPITRGPLVSVFICALAVVAALPCMAWRCVANLCCRRGSA